MEASWGYNIRDVWALRVKKAAQLPEIHICQCIVAQKNIAPAEKKSGPAI